MQLTDKKKYQLLLEISQKVGNTLDLDVVMEQMLDSVRTIVDYDAAGIFILNQDLVHRRYERPKEVIAGIARRGFDKRPPESDAMLTLGKGIIGHVISSGDSLIVPDVRINPYYIEGRSHTRSEIAVPIVHNERAIGALNLESDRIDAFTQGDLEVLQFFADAAAISIEKAMLHRQLLEKELIDKQLELARDLQQRLFPSTPPCIDGYDIAGICLPTEEIGGDYYDFIHTRGGNLGVAVADVSGNGIAAALFMTAFRGLLRTHAFTNLKPEKIVQRINLQLPNFTGDSNFITAVYAILSASKNELTYASCGHPAPLVVHPSGGFVPLNLHGPALGIFSKASFPTGQVSLSRGDIVVLYTDGVVELSDQMGAEFGVEGLAEAVYTNRQLPAEKLIQSIIQKTQLYDTSLSYIDDFTLVIIKRM